MKTIKLINQKKYTDVLYLTHTDDESYLCGKSTTVATSGCGLCAAMMVVDLLTDKKMSIEEAVEISYKTKANHSIGTSMRLFAPLFCAKYGLKYIISDDTLAAIKCLETNGAVIAHVASYEDYECTFSKNGHYIVLFAYDKKRGIAVLDPSFSEHKYKSEARSKRVIIEKQVVWVKPPDLDNDTYARAPRRYYLFWNNCNMILHE